MDHGFRQNVIFFLFVSFSFFFNNNFYAIKHNGTKCAMELFTF